MTSPLAARLARSVALPVMAFALSLGAVAGAHAQAAETASAAAVEQPAPKTNANDAPEVQAVIVTAQKGRAASVAPVTSSLKATEPEAVITRKFIEESAPRVGDYTTTAVLAPSLATIPNSNGPGATDGAKLTLRGFQDGEYNTTYDGIAWGDTNGPSHHSNSFFPSSTIGAVIVDRGPGQASDLGQANFGGSVNLFSLPFEDRPAFRQTFTSGSFQTNQSVTTLASGPIRQLHDANVTMNFMEYNTNGYLTHSPSSGQNQFIKVTLPVTSKISITGLYTHNYDTYNQGDASGNATVAQTEAFGKRFALSGDPTLSTFYGYNRTKKQTDFEYVRAAGDIGHGLGFEETVYSYAYNNRTLSANNNGLDSTVNVVPVVPPALTALQKGDMVTLTPAALYPAPGAGYSSKLQTPGLPGYLKRNQYRVIGDTLKFNYDTPFGKLTAGAWYEFAHTERSRFDIDLLTRLPDYREKAALFPPSSGCNGLPTQVVTTPGSLSNGACEEPLNVAYNEFSGWHQYQPFVEFEWKVNDRLTIEPGYKYVFFKLFIHAPAEAVKGSISPNYISPSFTKSLPFLTANYRIRSNWTAYAQYAQGFLAPNISNYYVIAPNQTKVQPQESTNYQVGSVYNGNNFTLDGDLYYIVFNHKFQTFNILTPAGVSTGETYSTNTGGAIYKGLELQGTYLFPHGLSFFGNGSLNDARGFGDPNNPGYDGHQIAKAPFWTAAVGARLERHDVFYGDDRLVLNLNNKWIGQQFANAASGTTPPQGLVKSFNEANFSGTYTLSHYSVELQLLNLFDHTDITSAKGSQYIPGTDILAPTTAALGAVTPGTINNNVFTYQTGRSYQLTLKIAF